MIFIRRHSIEIFSGCKITKIDVGSLNDLLSLSDELFEFRITIEKRKNAEQDWQAIANNDHLRKLSCQIDEAGDDWHIIIQDIVMERVIDIFELLEIIADFLWLNDILFGKLRTYPLRLRWTLRHLHNGNSRLRLRILNFGDI